MKAVANESAMLDKDLSQHFYKYTNKGFNDFNPNEVVVDGKSLFINKTVEECQSMCMKHDACVAISYDKPKNICWLRPAEEEYREKCGEYNKMPNPKSNVCLKHFPIEDTYFKKK